MNDDLQLIEGRVKRVIFANEDTGFSVFSFRPARGGELTVVGITGDLFENDELRLHGIFEEHPKFGSRFKAQSALRLTPQTLIGIEKYLAGPRVEGIGPELARRLVKAFGDKTLEVLDDEPVRLTEVEGIGKRRADTIATTWRSERERRELLIFLQGHGLGPALALRAADALGDDGLGRVQHNPYLLAEKVSGVGFRLADRVARAQGTAADAPSRLNAGLSHALDEALVQGHICLPGPVLLERAADLLEVDQAPLRQQLKELVATRKIVIARDSPERDYNVYDAFAFDAETEAAQRLSTHLNSSDPLGPRLPTQASKAIQAELSSEQSEAIRGILQSKVAVLTGGPGVGKTTVLRSLVRIWRDRGLRIALACPTGRAAKRLEQVSGLEATTIHRLLKFDGGHGRFAHGTDYPLAADIIVIDETSMLDLPLFLHLLRALPEGARLLLVGDAEQLPSVGPGTVLRDVIAAGVVPVLRLTRVFRQAQGSRIIRVAHEILAGRIPDLADDGADLLFIEEKDPRRGAEIVTRLLLEEVPRRLDQSGPGDVQILSPMHKGPVGTLELNRSVQQARDPHAEFLEHGDLRFARGDRIMQRRNDYDRELFNGDLGRVESIDLARGQLMARFGNARQEYGRSSLSDIAPAWAMTVHKSQGGEFPAVILPVYNQHFLLLKRPVLYTAVTRAKRLLVIVGDPRALALAVGANDYAHRHGCLRSWLQGLKPQVWKSEPSP
ncbi:MAG: ATP-dependent RecD-like DNA helicase [Planctomycetota bacterium]